WVEKATEAVADAMPACAMCGENGPPRCVYCKDDAEKYARHALAAVLPLAQAGPGDTVSPAPGRVLTADQLDALPVGARVVDFDGDVWEKHAGHWLLGDDVV